MSFSSNHTHIVMTRRVRYSCDDKCSKVSTGTPCLGKESNSHYHTHIHELPPAGQSCDLCMQYRPGGSRQCKSHAHTFAEIVSGYLPSGAGIDDLTHHTMACQLPFHGFVLSFVCRIIAMICISSLPIFRFPFSVLYTGLSPSDCLVGVNGRVSTSLGGEPHPS